MSLPRLFGGIVAGLFLATIPFLHYVHLGDGADAHTDHAPRHGGQLGMVGDHHVEIRRRRGRIEAFVSDARRRPVRPREGFVAFDGDDTAPLVWKNRRLTGADRSDARIVEVVVVLDDGTRLETSFDVSEPATAEKP